MLVVDDVPILSGSFDVREGTSRTDLEPGPHQQ